MRRRHREPDPQLPVVTVLGGGIAGLTAAHELVERGFRVQLVEARESQSEEYACEIGGLAANQLSRVRAAIATLHPWLDPSSQLPPWDPAYAAPPASLHRAANLQRVERFRDQALTETLTRFPVVETIVFDKQAYTGSHSAQPIDVVSAIYDYLEPSPLEQGLSTEKEGYVPIHIPFPSVTIEMPAVTREVPADWQQYWDRHGVFNALKLARVLDVIRRASLFYLVKYFPKLAERLKTGPDLSDEEWLSGTFTPIKLTVPVDKKGNPVPGASAILVQIVKQFVARESFLVQIVGYTDTDGTPEQNRAVANQWAVWVKEALVKIHAAQPSDLSVWDLEDRLDIVVVGGANPHYDQSTPLGRALSNRVEFEVVEQIIPGEHGFRFFPAFYRNLFDTMRRTPIVDASGGLYGTAFDKLVPTPHPKLGIGDGEAPKSFDFRRISSLEQIREGLRLFCETLGFKFQDLAGFEFYVIRYLMSCAERRMKEAEPISFLEYVGGNTPSDRFSEAAIRFLQQAPRALAAMTATDSDARSQLDIYIQLLRLDMQDPLVDDMTLVGPTSQAWFDHWKAYLKAQGVRFFVGSVEKLEVVDGYMTPRYKATKYCTTDPIPEDANDVFLAPTRESDFAGHYFIMALSYQEASRVLWTRADHASQIAGPFCQIMDFDKKCRIRSTDGKGPHPPRRDPRTGAEQDPYPLRTISGVQYFFPQDYRFGDGNLYLNAAPWALTSISQFAYWTDRIRPVGEYLGQVSVDIGDWHAFDQRSPDCAAGDLGQVAWYSSSAEIADRTWTQFKQGLSSDLEAVVRTPRFYHLDDNIVFRDIKEAGWQGSAVFRVMDTSLLTQDKFRGLLRSVTFNVSFDLGAGLYSPPHKAESGATQEDASPQPLHAAAQFAEYINQEHNDVFVVAIGGEDKNVADFLVSPRVLGKTFYAAIRCESNLPICVACGQVGQIPTLLQFTYGEPLSSFQAQMETWCEVVLVNFDRLVENAVFELRAKGDDMVLSVANLDDCIEIVNGPSLTITTSIRPLRLFKAPAPPSSRITTAAVRANAIVELPSEKGGGPIVIERWQPGRLYKIGVGVGSAEPAVTVGAQGIDPAAVGRQLFDELYRKAKRLVIVEWTSAKDGIVISPIVRMTSILVRVLKTSDRGFFLHIADNKCDPVDGTGLSVSEIRDELFEKAEKAGKDILSVEAVGEDGLLLQGLEIGTTTERRKFAVAVLNEDRAIELVDAPALTVRTYDLKINCPEKEFVVLRNDAEFFITVPGQWASRPGLVRNSDEIPLGYKKLSADFGDRNPEIYYGTSRDCLLFKNWVPAGTYMATYTRMTTMEAANEFGRHAAATVIQKLLESAKRDMRGQPLGLVANFPQIWRVEDNEPPDLRFAKQLDKALCDANLPHVLDILGVTGAVDKFLESDILESGILNQILSRLPSAAPPTLPQSLASVTQFLTTALASLGRPR